MTREFTPQSIQTRVFLGALALLLCSAQVFAIAGVWRRTARRVAVVGTTEAASASSAQASQSAAAETAAAQSAAAAAQASAASAAAASQAAAHPAAPQKTVQQKLQELQSLYDQKLISQSDYDAAKAKILAEISQ
jgi:hypothetical protein